MWIDRLYQDKIRKLSETRPVVLLTGARQAGKCSLLQREFPEAEYVTFDHMRNIEAVTDSPEYFLNRFAVHDSVILDEIQNVPGLFREIKILVDKERNRYGKWLLTGSQQFELMKEVSESLAGRISIQRLETLSARELRNSGMTGIEDFTWKGGYPEIWGNPDIGISDFFESYLRTYVERDLKSIIDVKNLHDFQRFIRVLAARAGQLVNYKDISSDTGVSDVTVRKWLHALEVSGLVYLLAPYYSNIGKRLIKSPKIFFADQGLLCHLLGIESMDGWNSHIYRGNLWENFVFTELVKTEGLRPGVDIFFYRDQNGVEIDFIAVKKNKMFFIEAKSTERIDSRQLNFKKVIPLFPQKTKTSAFIFQRINEASVDKRKDYFCANPLLTDTELV